MRDQKYWTEINDLFINGLVPIEKAEDGSDPDEARL